MDYLKIILTSLFSLAALFLLTKLVGAKQVSELSMFDYINGISIGSIAAEMATELEDPIKPLIAMAVYAVVSFLISILNAKSVVMRRLFFGKTVVLMRNGKLYRENLRRAHLDINEFLMQCRAGGYFDISAINTAVLEPSGKISILPFSQKRPATPEDLKTVPAADEVFYNVIMEGGIMERNLADAGYDSAWLKNELEVQGKKKVKDIYLATLSRGGTLNIFPYENEAPEGDCFG